MSDEPDLVSLSSGSEYEDTSYSVTETLESETTNVNCVDEKGVGEDTTVPVSKASITTEPVTNFVKPQSEVGDSSLNCIPNFAEDNPNKSAESVPDTTGSEPQGLDESNEPDTLVKNVTEDNSSVPRHDTSHASRLIDTNDEDTDPSDPSSAVDVEEVSRTSNVRPIEGGVNTDTEEGEPTTDSATGRVSPYLLVNKNLDVSMYESVGLLYASSLKAKDNRELMKPDEVAQDVLETYDEDDFEPLEELHQQQQQSWQDRVESGSHTQERSIARIDPGAVLDIERHAQLVATELNHVMDNLRNSLHAMTVCTKQSIGLHKESVDNLSIVVDANVKAMYVFMAKFEELHRGLGPLRILVTQIREIDEKLKVLERTLRVQ